MVPIRTPREMVPANPGRTLYLVYLLALAASLVGNLIIRLGARAGWLPEAGAAVLAAVSVLPLVIAAAMLWRLLRTGLDEMFQRIVLEGFAFALAVWIPVSALVVNLRTAGVVVPRADPPELLLTPALLVAVGMALSWRRFQ